MAPNPPEYLTLQEVADELGVHYMTVYRYVRIGMLPAHKDGRLWRVSRSDLDAMASPDQPPAPGDGTPWAERLLRRMTAGDESGSWKVIEAALAGGMTPRRVLEEMITGALHRVGDLWAGGEIGVDEEHVASAIATRLVGRLSARFARRGVSRGTIVLGATEKDLHALPSALTADVLRLSGFDVVDLGSRLPPADFARAAARVPQLVAVGVSVTLRDQDEEVEETVRALRDAVDVPIFLGGRAVSSRDEAVSLGADEWAPTAGAFADLVSEGR